MNLNKVFLLGNLTRDPEIRVSPNGQQVVTFGLATNRFYTDSNGEKKQEAEFHNIVCFGKLADISSKFLSKGSLVLIEGRLKTRNWINAQGLKQYRTEIIAEGLQLGPKNLQTTGEEVIKNVTSEEMKEDEIPVIEENYPPPEEKNENQEEIDVKDIPF